MPASLSTHSPEERSHTFLSQELGDSHFPLLLGGSCSPRNQRQCQAPTGAVALPSLPHSRPPLCVSGLLPGLRRCPPGWSRPLWRPRRAQESAPIAWTVSSELRAGVSSAGGICALFTETLTSPCSSSGPQALVALLPESSGTRHHFFSLHGREANCLGNVGPRLWLLISE